MSFKVNTLNSLFSYKQMIDFGRIFWFEWQVKQKQRGAKRMLLPTVVGQEGGKWVVIDSGIVILFYKFLSF